MIGDILSTRPFLAVVDSIQTTAWSVIDIRTGQCGTGSRLHGAFGATGQRNFHTYCAGWSCNKDGNIAGPRMLEHLVDVVLYFEGDPHRHYRILRGVKNRFGSTYEIGLFEMGERGLREVSNPAAVFAGSGGNRPAGSVVTVTLEGNRPMLIEMQALVAPFHGHGFPRRTVTGIDANRLAMILAVLEKRLHIPLGSRDVFVNVTGGITISEPAGDLGIAAAILSSFFDIPLHAVHSLGEVGLSCEISRPEPEPRLREARNWAIQRMIPKATLKRFCVKAIRWMMISARTIDEVKSVLF
jgi:DNA repair protein RadA/Sms